jgi:rubrerythrin
MNKYNVKATSGYISKYKLVAMLDEARKNETNGIADKTYEKAIEITETMDDADVAPVVHGHWSKELRFTEDFMGNRTYGYKCSVCGKLANRLQFCGNCGAIMDEKNVREVKT